MWAIIDLCCALLLSFVHIVVPPSSSDFLVGSIIECNVTASCEKDDVDEKLALLVEEERTLWDPRSEDYKAKALRNLAWDKIFVKMKNKGYDRNIDELKRMWRNMRTAYIRHKAGSTGSPASTECRILKFKYLDSLV
ncbi:unnamed protein product [Strongylus vulgaris]|uniref:MADF domain-containing protein n=1 Tax=Strongylus vulgaris TaxID=40348 RepID=A0A3P7LNB8_STRVU|nr:unnamed protein product [Strongylus vulgaris]